MTSDARRAELEKIAASYLRATCHYVRSDRDRLINLLAEAEARGIAKGLEMAADHLDECGVNGQWAAEEVRTLSQSTTKGQGR